MNIFKTLDIKIEKYAAKEWIKNKNECGGFILKYRCTQPLWKRHLKYFSLLGMIGFAWVFIIPLIDYKNDNITRATK